MHGDISFSVLVMTAAAAETTRAEAILHITIITRKGINNGGVTKIGIARR